MILVSKSLHIVFEIITMTEFYYDTVKYRLRMTSVLEVLLQIESILLSRW